MNNSSTVADKYKICEDSEKAILNNKSKTNSKQNVEKPSKDIE